MHYVQFSDKLPEKNAAHPLLWPQSWPGARSATKSTDTDTALSEWKPDAGGPYSDKVVVAIPKKQEAMLDKRKHLE
jgi:hypothetical protein